MVLLPLLAAMFIFGVCPNVILTDLHYSVTALLNT
jgi:NADH:ubiquinone oxidoreductase subunit 4 (subunit M)